MLFDAIFAMGTLYNFRCTTIFDGNVSIRTNSIELTIFNKESGMEFSTR